jgi:phage baseplate assembly protein gpV
LHRLRKHQTLRTYVQVKLADLARELAGNLGVTVEANEAGPVWHRLIQHELSDLEFLTNVAARSGLYLTLRENVLHILTLKGIGEPVELTLGKSLLEAKIEWNGDPSCCSVSTLGWDPWHAEAHHGRTSSARTGRVIAAPMPPDRLVSADEVMLLDAAVQDDHQADSVAQAELDRRTACEVSLCGVAEGDPRLRPGTPVKVQGVAAPLSGQYVLTAVTHTMDADKGFISSLSTLPPHPSRSHRRATAALGEVSRTDDPESLGRVQVSFPTYGNTESDWMEVMTAGAGEGKGIIALPEVGDRVLVLLVGDDPVQGVVLGGLYGVHGPPDQNGDTSAARPYTLLTPAGQRVRLDDARNLIRLENSEGSYLELSPDKVLLHGQTDIQIEAPGRSVVIRGKAVDFQKA